MSTEQESPEYGKLEKAAIDFTIKHREDAASGDFGKMEHLAQAASVIQAISLARTAAALERIAGALERSNLMKEAQLMAAGAPTVIDKFKSLQDPLGTPRDTSVEDLG